MELQSQVANSKRHPSIASMPDDPGADALQKSALKSDLLKYPRPCDCRQWNARPGQVVKLKQDKKQTTFRPFATLQWERWGNTLLAQCVHLSPTFSNGWYYWVNKPQQGIELMGCEAQFTSACWTLTLILPLGKPVSRQRRAINQSQTL